MIIDFQKNCRELFSDTFFKVHLAKTRYVVVYGGAASGKSYSVHQRELMEILKKGRGDTLVLRKSAVNLRHSCFKLFTDLIAQYRFQELFSITYSGDQRKITFIPTGRSLIFKGSDEPEKLKSIVGIKRIVMEEASQFRFEDFLELNRRARGFKHIQLVLILNPVSENHWIKRHFCDMDGTYHADTTLIQCTYKDNCNLKGDSFLTKTDIKELERLKEIDENQYRIYALGEWGIDNKESKFCWAFNRSQIKSTVHNPATVTWASFDFNINPLTCTVAQIFPEDQTLRAIECIKLENSDIWKMCDRLKASYPDAIWMVTGDATGQNRSAAMADNMNYYMIIERELRLNMQQLRVPVANPRIELNRVLVNQLHKTWKVEIDPEKCAPLIYDLQYVEVNAKGEIIKDRSSPERYADFLDNWRYLINAGVAPFFERRGGVVSGEW